MRQKKIVQEALQIITASSIRAEKQRKAKKAQGIKNEISTYSHPRN